MGYTLFTTQLIERHLAGVESVLEYGSQNVYLDASDKPPFASEWYKHHGIEDYVCVDLAGDNGALKLDIAYPIDIPRLNSRRFDLVTDFGTGEHVVQMEDYESISFHDGHINSIYPKGVKNIVEGFYNFWLNKHNYCRNDGLIISENPKKGHWGGHGYTYLDLSFYMQLANLVGYEILELGEIGAMGNWISGVNIYSALRKKRKAFIPLEEFKTLSMYKE